MTWRRGARMLIGGARLAILAAVVQLAAPRAAQAQLISPGKLAAAHAQIEGMSNCTKCHDLGKPGVSAAKCLSCHETLRARIQQKKGLHSTFANRTCGSCHKDHFGPDFAMVRLDTAGFDHKKAGFELRLGHLEPTCRKCHKEALIVDPAVRAYATINRITNRTFLGLGTGCMDCHRTDNVHADQFGARKCTACHTEETWKKAPLFNHDSTKYVLTGKHRTADCEKCHKPMVVPGVAKEVTRYVGVRAAQCTACHVDRHNGTMRQTCESCHGTDSWTRLRNRTGFEANFDHMRTKFQLNGAHAALVCATCHNPSSRPPMKAVRIKFRPGQANAMYPAPVATGCLSCHLDAHDSTFVRTPGGPTCTNCHNDTSWLPSSYDLARHNRETYVLTGAHIAVSCSTCHKPVRPAGPPQFRLGSRECVACHRERDPHAGQFQRRACTDCHVTETFRIVSFDHAKTRYPLDGAHRNVQCAKCHTVTKSPNGTEFTRYRPLETTCRSCHAAAIPRRS